MICPAASRGSRFMSTDPSHRLPALCSSHNMQIVLAILGLYAGIAGYYQVKGKFAKANEVRAMPAPAKPDFHTRE